jgi:glyoxylase-like metal-dependent hydrolase (beta-lactamase superfamily II)
VVEWWSGGEEARWRGGVVASWRRGELTMGCGAYDKAVEDRLYFRQLLAGQDFAAGNEFAVTMRNHVYVVGDARTRDVLLVDPAYDVAGLLGWAAGQDLHVVGAVATHYHADHVGGQVFGEHVEGLADLLEVEEVPIHVQKEEVPWVSEMAGVPVPALVHHGDGDVLRVGSVELQMLHTPGHTPGSQCLWVGDNLVTGDTLFLDGCGRTDLPGADGEAMFATLRRLASLPARLLIWPGHHYSEARSAPLEELKHTNPVLHPLGKEEWLRRFAG